MLASSDSVPPTALREGFAALARRPAERMLARFLRAEGVEGVLAEYGVGGVEVMEACAAAQVPLVVHFHGFDAFRTDVIDAYRRRYQRLFELAHRVVAGTKQMQEHLVRLGASPAKVMYCPVGADTDRFRGAAPDAAPPHFLVVGRLVEEKAPPACIDAFAQVAASCPEARLTIIGDGPLRGACEAAVARHGLRGRVDLLGALPHQQLPRHMKECRALVQHSIVAANGANEGTALSVLEAGAAGLPVVATRIGGIAESVLDGETGFLVEPGDVRGMADRMLMLARDPALAASLGASAQQRVRSRFSLEENIARLRGAFAEPSVE